MPKPDFAWRSQKRYTKTTINFFNCVELEIQLNLKTVSLLCMSLESRLRILASEIYRSVYVNNFTSGLTPALSPFGLFSCIHEKVASLDW